MSYPPNNDDDPKYNQRRQDDQDYFTVQSKTIDQFMDVRMRGERKNDKQAMENHY
jgi:hypothetical protein